MPSQWSPRTRIAAGVAGWLAAAALATGAGIFAVGTIGEGIVPAAQQPRSQQEAANLPDRPPDGATGGPTAARPEPTGTGQRDAGNPGSDGRDSSGRGSGGQDRADPAARQSAGPSVLSTPGGTILASCARQRVVVSSASPAQGFRVDEDDDDDEGSTEVKFNSENVEVTAKLSCAGGKPRARVEREVDD